MAPSPSKKNSGPTNPAHKKTRESKEGAAAAVQAMHGDSFAANRVDPDPKRSISFGDDFTGPPAISCSRDDVLVSNGAAAPKSCLSPLEMRTPTATGGLLSGKTSTATRTTFDQLPRWFYPTEETNLTTSTIYASYYSGFYLLATPCCRRVIETKSGRNIMFDPGDFTGRLRNCSFWGT